MMHRALSVFLALCAACLPTPIAMASQPAGIAGELITETFPRPDFLCSFPPFEGYQFFGPQLLNPGDTLTLEIALVPFSAGETAFSFDAVDGPTFAGFVFAGGRVAGLPYNRSGWNAVKVVIRPATQDLILTVNGGQSGPIPFADSCREAGGCFSAQAWRIDNGSPTPGGSTAWIDTLTLARDSPAGHEILATRTWDVCGENGLVQTVSGILIGEQPPRFRPRR